MSGASGETSRVGEAAPEEAYQSKGINLALIDLRPMSTVRFMTYNIQGNAASKRSDHIPKIAEVISAAQADVVGLQEVHCRTRTVSLADQAEQIAHMTGLHLHFGRSCAMEGGDYGNSVLTRGTIEHAHVHPLPGSGEPRSLLESTIVLGELRFQFYVTHLAAWGRLLRVARMQQIKELGDIAARGSLPHVLVGDFNVPPKAEELRALLSRGHLHIVGDSLATTFPMTRQRLDYILCDAQWEYVTSDIIRRGPSDHWPVIADLKMRSE